MSEKTDMQVEESKMAYSTALPEQKAFFPPQADPPTVDKRRTQAEWAVQDLNL